MDQVQYLKNRRSFVNIIHQLNLHLKVLKGCLLNLEEVAMDLSEEESAPLVIRDRGGSQRSSSSTGPSLQVHLYFLPTTKEATTMHILCGQISAENVCIQVGKKCGKISLAGHETNLSKIT